MSRSLLNLFTKVIVMRSFFRTDRFLAFFVLYFPMFLPAQNISPPAPIHPAAYELQRAINARDHSSLPAARPAQLRFDVTYYALDLDIDTLERWLTGAVTVRATVAASILDTVWLDLHPAMQVDSVRGDAGTFERRGDALLLPLKQSKGRGEHFEIVVHYNGRPVGGGFGGFVFDQKDGAPHIWTLSEPMYARNWWPCKDSPDDKADSVDVTVTVPVRLQVASQGRLIEQRDNGDGTHTFFWQSRYPITTYLVSLAIADYRVYSQWFQYSETDSMEIRNYLFPSVYDQAVFELKSLPDMLAYFHQVFGPYPFLREKYGIAQFNWGGGMEHQTISSQKWFGETLTAHELAHQWWGDMITMRTWGDIWLNEGFATYSVALYREHRYGRASYEQYMNQRIQNWSGSVFRQDTTDVYSLFDRIVYNKGAWVLHMLRHVVGDSTFFDILRAYARDPERRYGTASTADFQAVCEAVSGMDLDGFFDPWIYGTGKPVYHYTWQHDLRTRQFNLEIRQAQVEEHQLFAMPVDIRLIFPDSTRMDTTLFVAAETETFRWALSQSPMEVVLDPDNWILKDSIYLGVSGPGLADTPADYVLYQNYPNPFNLRTVIPFYLPSNSRVAVRIYNLAGHLVRRLGEGEFSTGMHRVTWDGRDDQGRTLSSGVYVFRLQYPGGELSRKLLLLK